MSMWEGHPILAEIRQGFKLRPTTTVDKSRPVIEAEGEEPVAIKYERKTPPPVIYTPQPKAQPKSICRVPQEALNIKHTPRAVSPQIPKNTAPKAPRPPSAPVKNAALLKLGGEITDRMALLNSIKGGIKLRKTTTVDKSGLILDDEQKALLAARNGGVVSTPGSSLSASQETLDSQGYSSLTPPSVHSGADDESFNSRFSDSESESNFQPPPPEVKKVLKPVTISTNAPPPPPPPPAGPQKFAPAPPPPPPPMPMGSRRTETQEKSLALEAEKPPTRKWQPPPKEVVKEEPKKPDAAFEGFKVSKEAVEAEIPRGSAASRIAAFAKMVDNGGSGAVFPKVIGPLVKNPPKRALESGKAAEEPSTKATETPKVPKPEAAKSSKSSPSKTEEKPKSSSSSSATKQLVTKDEVKVHDPKEKKSESKSSSSASKSSSSSASSKPKASGERSATDVSKKSSSSSSSKTSSSKSSDLPEKVKTSSSTGKSASSSSAKDEKPKSSKTASETKEKPASGSAKPDEKPKSASKTSESKEKKPSATVHSPANKFSVPITVNTDPPPIPKSQPPAVSPASSKLFKDSPVATEGGNTRLGPYKYNGPKSATPSPGGASTVSPNSGSYHTAVSSATSSYSSVPEAREKPSPVSSLASSSAATSPRSTTSGADSAKENNLDTSSSLFSRVGGRSAGQHSRNFEKLRQSFGNAGDANNNANAIPLPNPNGVPAWKQNASSSGVMNFASSMYSSTPKTTAIPIKAPWYHKDDYPEARTIPISVIPRDGSNASESLSPSTPAIMSDPESMNPEIMRGAFKFTIDLKKDHPIEIVQR